MNNYEQIKEIDRYRRRLTKIVGKRINIETAALIWIRKYAKAWRIRHSCNFSSAASAHTKSS